MKFSLELNNLIGISKEYLRKKVDLVIKLTPFVLATMSTSFDLRTIYGVLHKHPEHVMVI